MNYQPRPIDTSRVVLGPELIDLTEKLAENAHEVWGLQRVKDGWTVGSKRDDSKKEHPCLIPYDQLPESEKVYDRNASMETLKAILALGFQILPPHDQIEEEPVDPVETKDFSRVSNEGRSETGRVVVFSGHRIDAPGRKSPRFPIDLEEPVRLAIRERLESVGGMIGYGSAATGADLLFLEELLARGGEAHVVLPYEREQFLLDSVAGLADAGWLERIRRVLDQSEVITASPQRIEAGGLSYEFANLIAQGLGSLTAKQLDAELIPMAVWDGLPADGKGGTVGSIDRWRSQGFEVEVIDLAAIAREHGFEPSPALDQSGASVADSPEATGSRIAPILFADVVGFGKLKENEIPRFVSEFLGLIATTLKRLPEGSVQKKNTWGDGLYCVFDKVEVAGRFALDLRDAVVETLWEARGLPRGMNIRIAVHAGPVYVCTDPVTERLNCLGTHVSHASRIEPIIPPGQVYASQAFAALAAASLVTEFDCHYVGQTPLSKGLGTFPTYHVHRSSR